MEGVAGVPSSLAQSVSMCAVKYPYDDTFDKMWTDMDPNDNTNWASTYSANVPKAPLGFNHLYRAARVKNFLKDSEASSFCSPVVFDWDNDGDDDVMCLGGTNMDSLVYLEMNHCMDSTNTKAGTCSGNGICGNDQKCSCTEGYVFFCFPSTCSHNNNYSLSILSAQVYEFTMRTL